MIMLNKTTLTAIRNADMNTLNAIITEVKLRQRSIQAEIGGSFQVGDSVYFNDKRGAKVTGTITKVNRKTIKVTTMGGNWSVSPSLLRAA